MDGIFNRLKNAFIKQSDSFYCEFCDIKCSGPEPMKEHLKSAKHLGKVSSGGKKMDFFTCDMCEKQFQTKELYNQHLNHPKHKKKMEMKLHTNENNHNFASASVFSSSNAQDNIIWCDVCGTSVTGEIPWAQHKLGKKHLKNVNRKENIKTALQDSVETDGRRIRNRSVTNVSTVCVESMYKLYEIDRPATEEMFEIVRNGDLGHNWKKFGLKLGLTDGKLDDVEYRCYLQGIHGICCGLLTKWKEIDGDDATVRRLIQALNEINRIDLINAVILKTEVKQMI